MSTPPDCIFPEATLRELAQLSGSPTPDFSSMDFVGEPWAWVEHLARDRAERAEYLRDSGAPGPMLVDFRETFSATWSADVSARLVRLLVRMCEDHFAMVAQGLHRRPGYYVGRLKPVVGEVRMVLDPLFASAVPEEQRKVFLAARSLEASAVIPASARTMGLQLMKAKPTPGTTSVAKDPAKSVAAPAGNDGPGAADPAPKRAGSQERARRKRALEKLRVSQNLLPAGSDSVATGASAAGSHAPGPQAAAAATATAAATTAQHDAPSPSRLQKAQQSQQQSQQTTAKQQTPKATQQHHGRGGPKGPPLKQWRRMTKRPRTKRR